MSFHDLISHFLLMLNNIHCIMYNECTTVWIVIYLLKGILVTSNSWQSWIKLLEMSMCRFLREYSFQTSWVNPFECNCWIDHRQSSKSGAWISFSSLSLETCFYFSQIFSLQHIFSVFPRNLSLYTHTYERKGRIVGYPGNLATSRNLEDSLLI